MKGRDWNKWCDCGVALRGLMLERYTTQSMVIIHDDHEELLILSVVNSIPKRPGRPVNLMEQRINKILTSPLPYSIN